MLQYTENEIQDKNDDTFQKAFKANKQTGYDINLLIKVVDMLATGIQLPEKYRDHSLTGNWKNYRECHIKPDWLLIYKYEQDVLVLTLSATGTHSDLFGR